MSQRMTVNYKVGDIVQRRDGGPPMRIVQVTRGHYNTALVEWTVDGVAEIATLPLSKLVACSEI